MNILTITSLFPNHLQPNFCNFIFQRIEAISRIEGQRVSVVAPVPYCPTWVKKPQWAFTHAMARQEKWGQIEVSHPRYFLLPKISMPFHGALMWMGIHGLAKKMHQERKFDIIDGHFIYPDGFAALAVGRLLDLPVVLSARGTDINQYPGLRTIRPQIVHTLDRADGIISVCKGLKEDMTELRIPDDKINVIPNGIDISRFLLRDRCTAREELGLPINREIILAVGGLIPRKGFDFIIKACPIVFRQHPRAHLFIVGGGPEKESLQKIIEKLGLTDRISLIGEKPNADLNIWYNAADVFCLASSREGWANVLMESLACGTPVVATNAYGASEIIANENVGVLVDQTKESIAAGLITALDRNWDRNLLRKHVAGRNWDVVAREVKDVFEDVLNNRNRSKTDKEV